MSEVSYPFIDIAVNPVVRDRFAAGEAIILFSLDLKNVLWSNGAGARLFGNGLIYDFLDNGPDHNDVSFRQLQSTAAQLMGKGDRRSFIMRIASGFQRIAVRSEIERIEIEPGDEVIMFATPVTASTPTPEMAAHQMLEGFDDPDTHMAVIDGDGKILAASHDFTSIGISPALARSLVAAVTRARDGLIKRPIQTGRGYLPAAIGRLSSKPPLHLLFCVETVLGRMDPPDRVPIADVPDMEEPALLDAREMATKDQRPLEALGTPLDEVHLDHGASEMDIAAPAVMDGATGQHPDDAQDLPPVAGPADFMAAELPDAGDEPAFTFNRSARPVRFVWKIDTEGYFCEVSGEFAQAVGPHAGNIDGVSFKDLAALLNLDPEGKIQALLNRRDTWSGRTIFWPVEATNLIVPIDLAALPTYSRAREFDGFRGFGIIRLGDAEEDPHAMGLAFGKEPISALVHSDDDEVVLTSDDEEFELTADAQFAADPHLTDLTGDEFRGEPPAPTATPNEGRRFTDKVVQLEALRARAREGLTQGEKAAFREIARQLEPFGKPPQEALLKSAETSGTPVPQPVDEERIVPPFAEIQAVLPGQQPAILPEPSPLPDPEAELERMADAAQEAAGTLSESLSEHIAPRVKMNDGLTAGILDQMPVALLVHAGDRLIHANPEFFRLSGYDDLTSLQAAGGIDGLITRMDDNAANAQGAVFLVAKDESITPVTARLQSVRWEDQTALMLAIGPLAAPDVASHTSFEPGVGPLANELSIRYDTLRIEADELRAILETATDGVVLVSSEGEIRSMNRSASALFNYDNGETRGRPFAMLFAHESQKAVMDYLSGLAGHGVASVLNDGREVIGREANGGFIPLFMTMGKLASSNGYCAVIRDITQWKRSEEELKNAKRAAETANAHKSDFLARVSHEIRTPLNAIIGFSDMMSGERLGPMGHPRYVEYAHDIGRSGRHVLDIVNDLLDISKIEAGEMDLDFIAVGINDCISEAVSIIQPQANSQRVIIRTSLSQSVPEIVADLRSIKQIALNILANAIRFTPSGGQVVVSTTYEPNGSVVLRIRDTGVGMTRTELEQAMKPFRQITTGTAKRGDGTGLGLPLTKAMVEANRANFIISSAPNEGTLVEITFPSQRVLAD